MKGVQASFTDYHGQCDCHILVEKVLAWFLFNDHFGKGGM